MYHDSLKKNVYEAVVANFKRTWLAPGKQSETQKLWRNNDDAEATSGNIMKPYIVTENGIVKPGVHGFDHTFTTKVLLVVKLCSVG